MTDRELMQMVLDALGSFSVADSDNEELVVDVYKALRDRLAQPEPEPVAWFIQYEYRHEFLWREPTDYEKNSALEIKPLYTAPVHAIDISQERVDETAKHEHEWVGLTDEEVGGLTVFNGLTNIEVPILADFVRAIEAKLKEKNT